MNIPYIITDNTVTVFLDGVPKSVPRNSHVVAELVEVLAAETPDLTRIRKLLDPVTTLNEALDGSGVVITPSGTVTFRGKRIVGHLEKRILDIAASGLDPKPWQRFVERIYANPLPHAREELALFLEHAALPITPDGCFLAYKKVRADYKDIYTGTMDNSVGQVVTMPGGRKEVDPDRYRTCSVGLHFCSKGYLPSFGAGPGNRVMVVKIDPADVVAIPSDYNNTKGRTWKYEVVDEISIDDANRNEWAVVEENYRSDDYDWDEQGDDWEDFVEDDEASDWEEAFEADLPDAPVNAGIPSTPAKQSWWRRVLKGY